jgi:hypothetical protein
MARFQSFIVNDGGLLGATAVPRLLFFFTLPLRISFGDFLHPRVLVGTRAWDRRDRRA